MFSFVRKILNYFLKFEFIRFGIVGFLNTLIDYGVMNILMFALKVNQGSGFIAIKTFSIALSVVFSYYANLLWTFKLKKGNKEQLIKFVVLSVITIGVNVWIAGYMVDNINVSLDKYLWANIASLIGAVVAIVMRYFGSRVIFKKKI